MESICESIFSSYVFLPIISPTYADNIHAKLNRFEFEAALKSMKQMSPIHLSGSYPLVHLSSHLAALNPIKMQDASQVAAGLEELMDWIRALKVPRASGSLETGLMLPGESDNESGFFLTGNSSQEPTGLHEFLSRNSLSTVEPNLVQLGVNSIQGLTQRTPQTG